MGYPDREVSKTFWSFFLASAVRRRIRKAAPTNLSGGRPVSSESRVISRVDSASKAKETGAGAGLLLMLWCAGI